MRGRYPIRRIFPYVLISGGMVFTFQGLRDVVQWKWGQHTAAWAFESAAIAQPGEAAPASREQPRAGDTVARMMIPRLNVELYVVEGTDPEDLRLGPGHLTGTAMPGEDGNCVIAGHRDTHFRVLQDIRRGDTIVFESRKGRFFYRVKDMQVDSPDDTTALKPAQGLLHLITCYPFSYIGPAPKRLVVEAQRSEQ